MSPNDARRWSEVFAAFGWLGFIVAMVVAVVVATAVYPLLPEGDRAWQWALLIGLGGGAVAALLVTAFRYRHEDSHRVSIGKRQRKKSKKA